MTLTEFLLARITEDERSVGRAEIRIGDPVACLPTRVLAECEAKRRIVDASEHHARYDDGALGDHCRANLALLAAVYSDHPDYRESWKP